MNTLPTLVIVHAKCNDGLAAGWAARTWVHDAEVITGAYGQPAPDVTGRDVLIFDFSYPRDVLIAMHAQANSLMVVDHHDSAQKDLEGLDFAIFDMTKSGAVLAWEYLDRQDAIKSISETGDIHDKLRASLGVVSTVPVPDLLQYIQDRDIWQWNLYRSREINELIASVIDWDKTLYDNIYALELLNRRFEADTLDMIADDGAVLLQRREKLVKECASKYFWVDIKLDGLYYRIPVAFSPVSIRSEVAHVLASLPENEHATAVSIQGMSYGKFGMSYRGVGDTDLPQRLAIAAGGGGHKLAAGAGYTPLQLALLIGSAVGQTYP